jgi:hypothetical protein
MCSRGGSSPQAPAPEPAGQLHFPELGPSYGRGRRCEAIKADGSRCRAWAVRGSDPPLCAGHRQPAASEQRPSEQRLAGSEPRRDLTHIGEVVADLAERQAQLTEYLAALMERGADVEEVARLFALHGQNASRLGRLLRDQRALSGESADGLLKAIGKALDEIGEELGVEL